MGLSVLGPVRLDGADGPIRVPGRKAREILTMLVLASPRPLSVATLAAQLWEDPPPAATKTIQGHLSRLRTVLAAARPPVGSIDGTSSGYGFAARSGEVDVAVIDDLRTAARLAGLDGDHRLAAELLDEAVARWRGEPELPATIGGDLERAALAEQRLDLTEDRLAAMVHAGRSREVIAELDGLVAVHPLRERLWALLIEALYRAGRQADSLAQCRRVRRRLRQEIGVDPGPELRRLEQQVITQSLPEISVLPVDSGQGATVRFDGPHYAVAGDAHVAYGVIADVTTGTAPVRDLLLINPTFIPIDSYLEQPDVARAMRLLARDRRVIVYDRRGVGLSDPATPQDAPSIAEWALDAVAVLDAVGATTVDVLANADTSMIAVTLAADHAARVRAMGLVNAYPRFTRAHDYPCGQPTAEIAGLLTAIRSPAPPPGVDVLAWRLPAVAADPGFRAWWDAVGRRGASPRSAAVIHEVILRADVRDRLAEVRAPVLLLCRTGCASYDPGHSHQLAARLPVASLREHADPNDAWFVGDVDWVVEELDAFLRSVDEVACDPG
jgi:DNA-binding SARP family transcriptional activator/pimeloyl-ACP methyl ester carboxylesterase